MSTYALFTNKLEQVSLTGYYIEVPYLKGHDYALIEGVGSKEPSSTYCAGMPRILCGFEYKTELQTPKVV